MRRSKLTFLSLAGLTGAALFLAVTTSASWRRPVGLGLQSYSNGAAAILLTNLTHSKLDYILKVERKIAGSWPTYRYGIPVGIDSGQSGTLQPGQVSPVTVPVMVYAPPYPWRVSVFCHWNAPGPNTMRFKAGLLLMKLHMTTLSRKAFGEFRVIQVSGPQMDQ